MGVGSSIAEEERKAAQLREISPVENLVAPQEKYAKWLYIGVGFLLASCGVATLIATVTNNAHLP